MNTVTLYIETPGGQQTFTLENEISVGRTNAAQLVLSDPTLSRIHATIFREGGEIWLLDENSSNGSFVNGERIARDRKLRDGDEIRLGSNTRIYVEIRQPSIYNRPLSGQTEKESIAQPSPVNLPPIQTPVTNRKSSIPIIPLIGGASAFIIIIFAVIAFFVVRAYEAKPGNNGKPTPPVARINTGATIPIRVVDPLGGEDPDDLDDLISSWEAEEEPLKAEDIEEIKVDTGSPNQPSDLKVSIQFWQQQLNKSLNHPRIDALLSPPSEILGRGVPKQTGKLRELIERGGYKQPLDFADLAELRLKGTLVEMPIATEYYVLDVGGSATGDSFTEFDFERGNVPIQPGSPKYNILKQLADNFDGQQYDLDNPQHRKQMRMRLLRMYNPNSRKIFEEICKAYFEKFGFPLRVTSLTRSMDYQISLNKTNSNSFRVSGKGSLPPHTSGCAFDMSRKNLSNGEQNFIMAKLAELERTNKLDSLMEGSANACFHTFIYPDGLPPSSVAASTQPKKPK